MNRGLMVLGSAMLACFGCATGCAQLSGTGREPAPQKPPAIKEGLVGFHPTSLTVKQVGKEWKLIDGERMVVSARAKQEDAEQILKIIRHYGANQQGFVGGPKPAMTYLLIDGKAPIGILPGEDATLFNPAGLDVQKLKGGWKIVDGSRAIMSFGNKEHEAHLALAIIKKYGFTHICTVGRPRPSFTYFRK